MQIALQKLRKRYKEEQLGHETGKGRPALTISTWSYHHSRSLPKIPEQAARDRQEMPSEVQRILVAASEEAVRTHHLQRLVSPVPDRVPGQAVVVSPEAA